MWKILLVDDNPGDRKLVLEDLAELAVCFEAESGQQAIDLFKQEMDKGAAFDFVLLDVSLPDMEGFEVLKSIRSLEFDHDETRIIMITTYKDSLMENYNMGWDDFITKPVDCKILINRLEKLIDAN